MRLVAVTVALWLAAAPARADEWPAPQARRLSSPGGRWQATLVPSRDGRAPARATVQPVRGTPVSFDLGIRWMPVDSLLLDDGRLITFDEWHRLGQGKVVVAHGPDGRVLWSRTLEELLGKDRPATFRRSVSSLWWRPTPLVWALEEGGRTLGIRLADEDRLRIRLSDGQGSIARVEQLPDDPARLANRAETLRNQGKTAEAAELLERAVKRQPTDLVLQIRLVEALQQLGRHPAAIAAGGAALRVARPAQGGHNLANLHVRIADSQGQAGQPGAAESSLRAAVTAAPLYDHPALQLATFLVERGRQPEAYRVLGELVKRAQGTPNVEYLLLNVGDFFRRKGELARARSTYLRAFRPDQVTNTFLYRALAEVDEALGDRRHALEVQRLLLRHLEGLGQAFADDAARARAAVQRLSGPP